MTFICLPLAGVNAEGPSVFVYLGLSLHRSISHLSDKRLGRSATCASLCLKSQWTRQTGISAGNDMVLDDGGKRKMLKKPTRQNEKYTKTLVFKINYRKCCSFLIGLNTSFASTTHELYIVLKIIDLKGPQFPTSCNHAS